MPIEVEGPDGVVIEFPDNTPRATIQGVMAKRYPRQQSAPAKPAPARPAPKPAPKQSVGGAMLNSLAAVGGGMLRGVAPVFDAAADVGDAVTGGINALAHGRMPWEQDHNAPKRPAFRLGDVPDRLGTPRLVAPGAEFAANMLGGMATPIPTPAKRPGITGPVEMPAPKPVNAAREVVNAGKQAGVRVLTSDVKPPRTFIGKAAQAVGERIPITGTGAIREAQQVERITAVKNLLQDFGAVGADDAVDAVATDLAKTRGAMVTKLTTAKNGVIQSVQGAVPVPQATKAIDAQIARLSGINADAFAPVIAKLNEFKTQLASGKTLEQIEGNRKLLGDLFKDPSLAAIAGDGQKALNAIYAPLRADMGNFIKAKAGAGAFAKWQTANSQLAAMAGELSDGTFRKVLSTAEATPENVARMLFSKKPSDVARLYSNLSAEGRVKAQAAVLHQAMQKAGGIEAISPDRFANQIATLGRTAGVHFQAPDLARIEGLSRVLDATKRAAQAAVAPPTGVQAVPYAMGAGFTGLFGLPGGITAAGATGLLARAYESAPVRNALLKLGRAPAGSKIEAAALERASVALAIAMKPYAEKIAAAANSNTMPALAADPGTEQQSEQQPAPQP